MAIGTKTGGGTWWKVLLGTLGGFILGIGTVAGGLAIAGTVVKAGTLLGGDADKYLTKEYQEKTILEIVTDAIGGKMKLNTIGDLNNISPLVGSYFTGVKDDLNNIGCELTDDDVYAWTISNLSGCIVGSVKDAKLIRVLSKDKVDYPDPIIKFLSYDTYPAGDPNEGEYKLDEEGNLVHMHLKDMLDDTSYIQRKVDTMRIKMLFSESDIEKSSLLKAISNKSVKELSQDGAFDDVKIADVMGKGSSSKVINAFRRDGVTIGGISKAVDNLYLDDVIEYKDFSTLSPVLKKLIGSSNATETNPYGPEVTSPYVLRRMETYTDKAPLEYEYVSFSDGFGHTSNPIAFSDILGTYDSATNKYNGYSTITITKNPSTNEYDCSLSGSMIRDADDTSLKIIKTDLVSLDDIIKPVDWESHLYTLSFNQKTKVGALQTSVGGLKLKDAVDININDPLWKLRDTPVNDGKLFENIKSKLTIEDIFPDPETIKFIGALPKTTPIGEIGDAINDLTILKAFDENIYDASGNLKPTWKYMLIESGEAWIEDSPHKDSDPFKENTSSPYNCVAYKVGGSGSGMDALITNMTYNMQNGTIKQLHNDGIITLNDTGVITRTIPSEVKALFPVETDGCTYYGDMKFKNFVSLASNYVPTV